MELGLILRQIGYRVKQFGLEQSIKEQRLRGPVSRGRNGWQVGQGGVWLPGEVKAKVRRHSRFLQVITH